MAAGDCKRHKRKALITHEEKKLDVNYHVFHAKLYIPEYLKYYFTYCGGVLVTDTYFNKKKEAENYVYLLAIKRLYECGLYGDDMYPALDRIFSKNFASVVQVQSTKPNVNA